MTDDAAQVAAIRERDQIGWPTPKDVPADLGFALKFWQAFAHQAHADRATLLARLEAVEEVLRELAHCTTQSEAWLVLNSERFFAALTAGPGTEGVK